MGFRGDDLPESAAAFLAAGGFAAPDRAAAPETPLSDALAAVLVGAGFSGSLLAAVLPTAAGRAAAFVEAAGALTDFDG